MSTLPRLLLALLLGLVPLTGCPTGDDDDDASGDDDSAAGDDDTTAGDDDTTAGDDDDTTAGDDDTTPGDDDDSTAGDDDTTTGDDDDSVPPLDLAAAGPHAVSSSTGMYTPGGLCFMDYTVFEPVGAPAAPAVLLAHGFQRYAGVMEGLGEHFASWGLTTVTMDLCHATILDTDPPADAALLVELRGELGLGQVIYAGQSAGGLRSVLAAAQDPDAVAVLGLDLVDGDDLGLDAAPALAVPLYGLAGEPSSCNADGNGLGVYGAAPDAALLRITEADHCDFEDPTDWLCTVLCEGSNAQFSDDEIHATVRALATAYLRWQAGLDPAGEDWWTPGDPVHDALLASGAVSWP